MLCNVILCIFFICTLSAYFKKRKSARHTKNMHIKKKENLHGIQKYYFVHIFYMRVVQCYVVHVFWCACIIMCMFFCVHILCCASFELGIYHTMHLFSCMLNGVHVLCCACIWYAYTHILCMLSQLFVQIVFWARLMVCNMHCNMTAT